MCRRVARFTQLILAFLLGVALINAPVAARAAPNPCPKIMFVGMHGVNEGGPGNWGAAVNDLWSKFAALHPLGDNPGTNLQTRAIEYGPTQVSEDHLWALLDVKRIYDDMFLGAARLRDFLVDMSVGCPTAFTVIAGYSQGAWAVDAALRIIARSPNPSDRFALNNVAGVFLMADPAWPIQFILGDGNRSGIATWYGVEGYKTEADYLNNGLPADRFGSTCLVSPDGHHDPICHYGIHTDWNRDLPIHKAYKEGGLTQVGAQSLADLARKVVG
jgi:Cutinase